MPTVWRDGRLLAAEAAGISPFDRGLLLGDGVFETLRAYGGKPHALDGHLARLARSARIVGLPEPDAARLADAVHAVLAANGLDAADAAVRITLTAGAGGAGVSRRGAGPPMLLVTASPVRYDAALHERGVEAVVARRTRRAPPEVLDPRVKSLNYLPHVLARAEAEARGAFEAILLTLDGRVAEATSANVFALRGTTLATPPLSAGVLDGLTRAAVLALAPKLGLEAREEDLRPEDLAAADEVLLTASVAEVLPVVRLDGRAVGDGRPGPVARALLDAYRRHARGATHA